MTVTGDHRQGNRNPGTPHDYGCGQQSLGTMVARMWRRTGSAGERGGIVTGWLMQIVVFVLFLGVAGHEILAPLIGSLAMEDAAKRVVRAAGDELEQGGREADAIELAEAVAERENVTIAELTIEGRDPIEIHVVITREPETWLIHKWDALLEFATPDSSATRVISP